MKHSQILLRLLAATGMLLLFSGDSVRSPLQRDASDPMLQDQSIDRDLSPIAPTAADASWLQVVQKNIEASEYEIRWQEKTGAYQSSNRAQNLRFTYYNDGFSVSPRTSGAWTQILRLVDIGRGKIRRRFHGSGFIAHGNTGKAESEALEIRYTNTKEGMRQDFLVKARPEGAGVLSLRLRLKGDLKAGIQPDGRGAGFTTNTGELVHQYNRLKATDAAGREMDAWMELQNAGLLALLVRDDNAEYPILIDPLSTSANWTAESDQAGAQFGNTVATAGDVNGDGYSDVIVAAYSYDGGQTNEGKAFVFHGSASGLSTTANWTAESNQASAYFGRSVASAGDVNGDGYSDVIVGASNYDNGQTDEGSAFLYHGSASGLSATANWTAESDQVSAYFGMSVATAGDVNGDGYSEVIIGAHLYDGGQTDEGKAFVFHGSASGLSTTASWTAESDQVDAYFGQSVGTAADVNGDGYNDVIVGAFRYDNGQLDEGRAFVYHGSASGLSASANWTAESDQDSTEFGLSVATAGDVNGDGYSDVIVGAETYSNGETDEGKAFVYHGSSSGLSTTANWTVESDQISALLGHIVATAGDVNGDGFADVIVGVDSYDNGETNEGRAYLYHGSASGLSTSANWTAESDQASAYFGESLATAGDVNGDGYSDVVVGAIYYDNGQIDEGAAFVYHGSASGLRAVPDWTPESNQASAYFGNSVASAGDVNGDGYSDVIVGAYGYDNGQTNEGRAFVYHGSASGLSTSANWTAESNQTDAYFGVSVATAGDVNGDGYSDVIVGANMYDNGQTNEGSAFVYHGSASGLSTSANWSAESNQPDAYFGVSVTTAGDVNGDGYSDVMVGAYTYDNGQTNEGGAFVYHGSTTGLSTTANWTAESDQASAYFGRSVASAGDVNGDGFSDIIVGAMQYGNGESNEGRAFVYHGSASGLSTTANWTAESNQTNALLGVSVATAGDVNGDGYSDAIIGAHGYANGEAAEGRAFVYHGSASGLSAAANWSAESNQASAYLGYSVGTAGDVNGDGYSDVIVGAYGYDNGQTDEGSAFVYHGSASGLSTTDNWSAELNQASAAFGYSVAAAGDVNGDGYSDVVVGAYTYDNGQTDEGKAVLYCGNNGPGKYITLCQKRGDLNTMVVPALKTRSTSEVGFALMGRTFFGRSKVKAQFEVKPLGTSFDATGLTESSTWRSVGVSGVVIDQYINSLNNRTMYKWRARVRYRLSDGAPQPYGRWIYPKGNGGLGEADFQVSNDDLPLPVEMVSLGASVVGNSVELRWYTATEVDNYGFEIERRSVGPTAQRGEGSAGNGSLFTVYDSPQWSKVGFVQGSGTSTSPKEYSFIDENLRSGRYAYRIKQINLDGSFAYTDALEVAIGVPTEFSLSQNYPNPFNPTTTIEYDLPQEVKVDLIVYDNLGQEVKTLADAVQPAGYYKVVFDAKGLSSGMYYYRIRAGDFVKVKKLLFIK